MFAQLTLDDARKRRGEEVNAKPASVKEWFSKNKPAVLAITGIAVLGLGYMGYRYVFKAKNEVKNMANLSQPATTDFDNMVF